MGVGYEDRGREGGSPRKFGNDPANLSQSWALLRKQIQPEYLSEAISLLILVGKLYTEPQTSRGWPWEGKFWNTHHWPLRYESIL